MPSALRTHVVDRLTHRCGVQAAVTPQLLSKQAPITLCCVCTCLPARSSEFKQVKELGRGGFSIVFRATHRIDGCEYALKRTKSPVSDNKERNAWLQVRAPRHGWCTGQLGRRGLNRKWKHCNLGSSWVTHLVLASLQG